MHSLRQEQMKKQFDTEMSNQREAAERGGLDLQRKQSGEVRQQPRNLKVGIIKNRSNFLKTCCHINAH